MATPTTHDVIDNPDARAPRAGHLARDAAAGVTGGTPAPDRLAPDIRQPVVDAIVQDVRRYDHARTATREHFDATLAYDTARARYNREIYTAQIEHVRARAEFVAAMAQVYRDPADAVRRFEADARSRNTSTAVETLTTAPETYGTLRRTGQGWVAQLRGGNDTPARLAAHDAAVRAIKVEHRRADALDAPPAREALHHARERVDLTERALRTAPPTARLEHDLRAAIRDVTPAERRAIAAQLSDTQRAFLHTLGGAARDAARDIALNRDGRER